LIMLWWTSKVFMPKLSNQQPSKWLRARKMKMKLTSTFPACTSIRW
jgi:hypothetical protein